MSETPKSENGTALRTLLIALEGDRRVEVAGAQIHVGPGFDNREGSADREAMAVIVEAARLHAAANPMPCRARRCTNEAEHVHGPECAGCLCQRGER